MSSLCYAGTLHELSIESSRASLKTCAPKEGICFAAVNKAKGVLQLGCWPSQAFESGLAWWGNPMCKKDGRSMVCLCQEDLCNFFLPTLLPDPAPEWYTSPLFIILLPFLIHRTI